MTADNSKTKICSSIHSVLREQILDGELYTSSKGNRHNVETGA